MTYNIYQILDYKGEVVLYNHANWIFAERHGFNINDYKKVYTGQVENPAGDLMQIVVDVFYSTEIENSKNFTGHPFCVSDIVEIVDDDYHSHFFYYDPFGYVNITDKVI